MSRSKSKRTGARQRRDNLLEAARAWCWTRDWREPLNGWVRMATDFEREVLGHHAAMPITSRWSTGAGRASAGPTKRGQKR